MDTFQEFLEEQMKVPEFKREYDALEPEFAIKQALIDARKGKNMTQKQLAQATGITQADISKLEGGKKSPTLKSIQKLADVLDLKIKFELVPR